MCPHHVYDCKCDECAYGRAEYSLRNPLIPRRLTPRHVKLIQKSAGWSSAAIGGMAFLIGPAFWTFLAGTWKPVVIIYGIYLAISFVVISKSLANRGSISQENYERALRNRTRGKTRIDA